MANKKTDSKTQPSTKQSATKTNSTAKPAANANPAPKTAAKPAATAPKKAAKPAEKPAATAPKTANKSAVTPKTTAKPVEKSAAAPKTTKPAAAPAAAPKAAKNAESKPNKVQPATQKQDKKSAAAVAAATAPGDGSGKNTDAPKREKAQAAAKATTEKPAKAEKAPKEKSGSSDKKGGAAAIVALWQNKKVRYILMASLAFLLILAIVIGIVVGTRKPGFGSNGAPTLLGSATVPNDNPTIAEQSSERPLVAPATSVEGEKFSNEYAATSAVGFSSNVIDTIERKKPVSEVRDESALFPLGFDIPEGTVRYPKYGYTMNSVIGETDEKKAARTALIEESDYLTAYGTHNNSGNGNNGDASYTWMDKDGYLYSGSTAEPVAAINPDGSHRQLYKHAAAEGMYFGGYNNTSDLSDEEPGLVKEVTIRPRGYSSYSVTGLYAPAGEVIKIQMSEVDMNATGGITIHIGQALYNGQSNNIWVEKGQMQRFPNILNTMNVNKTTATLENGVYTAYVGSFIGGPLYIRNTSATFTATISGGVAYSHFILGYTTKEEFEENKKTSVPYFDLEVWNYGVLHSGPKLYAQNFTYENLYKAAVLWEKVSSVTTTGSNQGIVFLYDPFVAAGAAVAFPGRSSVNCPAGWMGGSLDYNAIVSSGSWGNFHEYHHNFQGYGVGNGGEVTNNGMTLVSYALFTKISSKRGIASYGAQGLGGWNNYTSATWALNDILSISRGGHPSNGDQGLALYATLLHNFGANNYIQAKVRGGGQSYQAYANAWEAVTHNNMSYYFNNVLKGNIKSTAPEEYPMFVPVSSVYQTGRSYLYDGQKKYFKTMQPYVIPFGQDFTIDLSRYSAPNGQYESGSVVIPDNFDYRIKSITEPENGKIEVIDNYHFKYTPTNQKYSGQIIATLEIIDKKGAFKVDDVDLVLEFEQSHETNKMTLERTTYAYTEETMYTDAVTAYENNFAGYTEKQENDHSNPTQNCNTDIWFYPDNEQSRKEHAASPESHFVHPNTVEKLEGKLYFEDAGSYRIYLRGRTNCAVFLTYKDAKGQTQTKSARVTNGSGANFYTTNPDTYIDIEVGKETFVNFTEVLIVQATPVISYIGLGYGKWTEPMFTMVEKYYDAEGNEVASPDAEGYHHTETKYYDYRGVEVSAEEANNAQLIAPTSATYINAYRSDYEFPDNTDFETDYFYTRNYSYTYSETHKNLTQNYVGENPCPDNFPIENLFDNDLTTACSSTAIVSADKPWELTIDLGKMIEANRFVLTGFKYNGADNKNQTPNSLTLYVGETLETLKEVVSVENGTVNGVTMAFNFETSTFRYYKLIVRKTVEGRFAAIANIEFSNNVAGGTCLTPDHQAFTYTGNWQLKQTQSTFGHVYVGAENATLSFKFNGTRLALLSSEVFGKNFEVTIDGQKITSMELIPITGGYGASFLSQLLEDKEHTVSIKCLNEASIDSVVIYK